MKPIKILALVLALTFLFSCTGEDSGGSGGFTSNGGAGGTGTGGHGGSINIGDYDGDGPILGDVRVSNSGSLDTTFTVPTVIPANGSNVLTISGNVTAQLNLGTGCAAGDVFLTTSSRDLSYCVTSGTPVVADDLIVQAGATLTLPSNYTSTMEEYGGGSSSAQILLSHTVTINGTVNTAADGVQISIQANGNILQIGPGGLVTTKPAADGAEGSLIYLYSSGIAINQGTIDASGHYSSATTGGAGGGIDFEADTYLYNTGIILSQGGSSASAAGGKGRHIHIFAYSADLYHSGTIDNSGGSGATSGGNAGYDLDLYAGADYYTGDYYKGGVGNLIAGGSVLSNGGKGGTGNGGYGGHLDFESYGGKLWSNATVSALGGNSTSAAGGDGGDFYLYGGFYYQTSPSNVYFETNGIKLSGVIDLSGGTGTTGGGNGGNLYCHNEGSAGGNGSHNLLPSPAVEIVGIPSLTLNGGSGTTGGSGGYYQVFTWPYEMPPEFYVFSGVILNQVQVSATGGTGTTTGGDGGWVDFNMAYTYESFSFIPVLPTAVYTANTANIDVSGGTGDTGGNGGGAGMLGLGTVVNSGAINAKGGTGNTTGGGPGEGWDIGSFTSSGSASSSKPSGGPSSLYSVVLISYFNVENTGAIDASGGKGGTTGGSGASVSMNAYGMVTNNGLVTTAGGNGATGGGGGEIDLYSNNYAFWPTVYTLTQLNTTGGTVGGSNGCIYIDDNLPVGCSFE
jgi:hypothetical protein